jgi:hypothetical protein
MLLAVTNEIAKPLSMLINRSLKEMVFPDQWKVAHVIDVFNKMTCELMLTYDTPALRQTGSRNLMGLKTLMWYQYEACDQISDLCHQ